MTIICKIVADIFVDFGWFSLIFVIGFDRPIGRYRSNASENIVIIQLTPVSAPKSSSYEAIIAPSLLQRRNHRLLVELPARYKLEVCMSLSLALAILTGKG